MKNEVILATLTFFSLTSSSNVIITIIVIAILSIFIMMIRMIMTSNEVVGVGGGRDLAGFLYWSGLIGPRLL